MFSLLTNVNQFKEVYSSEAALQCSTNQQLVLSELPSFIELVKDFFGKKENNIVNNRKMSVYAGGYPLGFTLECEGVIIIAIGSVTTEFGKEKPLEGKNIKVGDIVYSVDDEVVKNANHLNQILNKKETVDQIKLEIHRESQVIIEYVVPVKEMLTQSYKLGLWVRDNAAGVGTLTYIRPDNGRFGALGHPVCDVDTGKILPVISGNVFKCNIVGFNKGLRGTPGELRGLFLKNGVCAGNLDKNNDYGVYGNISEEYVQGLNSKLIEVGFKDSVKTGKAKILTTIDGATPKEYDIEIVKLTYQSKSDTKSMVIRVTDEELLAQTGGIVQGMSGSPIIQNDRLIGAVTHVFVSDPTKGFGVYIDWMIDN